MSRRWSGFSPWGERLSAADRAAGTLRAVREAKKSGRALSPVAIAGRTIAHTFWGKAWCDNLERYRDFAHRLERGRTYVRTGAVIDLRIGAGTIEASVSGSMVYEVTIEIDAIEAKAWRELQRACAAGIASRLELLSGRLSAPVMARLCEDRVGMFPEPAAIGFACTCPDAATMCKHVAATMYGVGARLDSAPELLFTLRKVSPDELHASAVAQLDAAPRSKRILVSDQLSALFGIDIVDLPARTKRKRRAR